MRFFHDLPIRQKLTLLLIVIVSVALLLSTMATLMNDVRTTKSLMAAQYSTLADVLGANSTAALNFQDSGTAEQVLASLSREPTVVFACTYDAQGKVFATYVMPGGTPAVAPTLRDEEQPLFEGGYLHVFKPIVQDDKPIGAVYLRASMEALNAQLHRHAWIALGVLAVSLTAAMLLAYGLQRFISRPILHLVEATRTVSANSDFSVRVTPQSQDELGVLCGAFNSMLTQIQQRDEELAGHRAHLEAMVRERTRSLESKTEELARSNLDLERSNSELQQFTLVSSHDLQEPLRKVQAFGDLLQTECGPSLGEQGLDYLNRMRRAATRARELIDALLTYSRITGKSQLLTPVDLSGVAQAAVADLETRIRHVGGRVEIGPLPTLLADRMQMRQLIRHLIDNGLKFRRPGVPPVVSIACDRDRCGTEGPQPRAGPVRLMFKDNGIGFEEKYLDRIFVPYERLQTRGQNEGTGMGLAICRKIVERHGGTITAQSAPGLGSTFIVTFPGHASPPLTQGLS